MPQEVIKSLRDQARLQLNILVHEGTPRVCAVYNLRHSNAQESISRCVSFHVKSSYFQRHFVRLIVSTNSHSAPHHFSFPASAPAQVSSPPAAASMAGSLHNPTYPSTLVRLHDPD